MVGSVVLTEVCFFLSLLALGTVLLFLRAAGDFLVRRFRFVYYSGNEQKGQLIKNKQATGNFLQQPKIKKNELGREG